MFATIAILSIGGGTVADVWIADHLSDKWAFNVGGNFGSAPVVGADGIIYVSLDEALYAFRPDGTQLWAFNVGSSCGTPPIGADGTTYVVCGDKLYALGP